MEKEKTGGSKQKRRGREDTIRGERGVEREERERYTKREKEEKVNRGKGHERRKREGDEKGRERAMNGRK